MFRGSWLVWCWAFLFYTVPSGVSAISLLPPPTRQHALSVCIRLPLSRAYTPLPRARSLSSSTLTHPYLQLISLGCLLFVYFILYLYYYIIDRSYMLGASFLMSSQTYMYAIRSHSSRELLSLCLFELLNIYIISQQASISSPRAAARVVQLRCH